jgi:hypothetical protein
MARLARSYPEQWRQLMCTTRKTLLAFGMIAAVTLTTWSADAHSRRLSYARSFGPYAYARGFARGGFSGANYVYGANRAYPSFSVNRRLAFDNPRDAQLLGHL